MPGEVDRNGFLDWKKPDGTRRKFPRKGPPEHSSKERR